MSELQNEMNSFSFNNKYIVVDEEKYWHYTYGGKWTATKSIVIEGIHFYNSNRPLIEERP
jgi:hypothetical protein